MRIFRSPELAWLVRQSKPFLRLHAIGLICIGSGSVLTLIDPLIMKWLIDTVLPKRNGHLLWIGTLAFAAVYFARLALTYCGSLVTFTAMQKLVFRTRMSLIRGLHRQAYRTQDEVAVGEMLYRIEQDVNRVGELGGDMLPSLIRMLLVSIMVVTTMCVLNARLTSMVLPLLPVFYLLQKKYRGQLISAADQSQQKMGSMSAILQEHLAGILQLQLLNRHGAHARKYARQSARGAGAQIAQRLAEVRFSAAYLSIIVAGSTLILGYGGSEVIHGRLTIGGLVAFYSYVTRLFEPMSIAVDLQSRTQRVSASIRRIIELQSREEPSVLPQGRLKKELPAAINFSSVSYFHREDRSALLDLSFQISPGEKIAIVGMSGCGKSTIAHLAVGLYPPHRGSILVNGQDISAIDKRNLRSIVSLVPQDPVLFDGTLRENLLYGDPGATKQDLEWVLSVAQLESLAGSLPKGLDEYLGPMGGRLSGGERKRVALARAILMRPKILILDEVTSGLDGLNSAQLLHALEDSQNGKTIIFISHEAKTISWADRILVLSGGRVVDEGGHSSLIRRCLLYQKIHSGHHDPVFNESPPTVPSNRSEKLV